MVSWKKILFVCSVSFFVFSFILIIESWCRIYVFNDFDEWLGRDITFGSIIFALVTIAPQFYVFFSYLGFKYSKGSFFDKPVWLGLASGSTNAGLFLTMACVDPKFNSLFIDTRLIMIAILLISSYFLPYISRLNLSRTDFARK